MTRHVFSATRTSFILVHTVQDSCVVFNLTQTQPPRLWKLIKGSLSPLALRRQQEMKNIRLQTPCQDVTDRYV